MKCGQIFGKFLTKFMNFIQFVIIFGINSIRTMREMSQYTKVGPASRIDRLIAFNRRLQNSPESSRHLTDWSLGLDMDLIKIPARILPYPQIVFGDNKK